MEVRRVIYPVLMSDANFSRLCRHWRHISMYHGPWLQMNRAQLEHLVQSNNRRSRPRPYDPAVLNDILRIRVAVDEATDFAVRAASGIVSAPSHGSMAAGKGIMHGAEALGLTFGANGVPVKLSKERQYRMREMATQKLSQAYHLDEIATSVATMQSASTLDDVAQFVLHRNSNNFDGTYVYFFHEKIPSRKVAEFTPLDALDSLIAERPNDASPYRTRALIKVFKEDFEGAVKDLTQGLVTARLFPEQHRQQGDFASSRRDEPSSSSLEAQMFFHRANVHLHIASKHILEALEAYEQSLKRSNQSPHQDQTDQTCQSENAQHRHLELRKIVKTNARKALRDYISFLSNFEYTPKRASEKSYHSQNESPIEPEHIYKASDLFSATPPSSLPPFPPLELEVEEGQIEIHHENESKSDIPLEYDGDDAVSFHPLLPEALCSLLICHAILQTPTTELRRHAHNAARLIRILGGLPVFALGRSSSGAVWSEILRATNNFVDLSHSWLSLCGREIALYGHSAGVDTVSTSLTADQKKDQKIQKAIMSSLTDEKAIDDDTFHRAVMLRLLGQKAGEGKQVENTAKTQKKRWNPEIPDEFFVFSSTMVEPVAKWIVFAPTSIEGEKTKSGARKKKKKATSSLEESVEQLAVTKE
jgi:hypothetical protein